MRAHANVFAFQLREGIGRFFISSSLLSSRERLARFGRLSRAGCDCREVEGRAGISAAVNGHCLIAHEKCAAAGRWLCAVEKWVGSFFSCRGELMG